VVKQRDESMMRFKLFASCNNAPVDQPGRQPLFLRPKLLGGLSSGTHSGHDDHEQERPLPYAPQHNFF
jgi:hypothetical protein